eukprot:TRINITY_DN74208_c0_g1_i1.p1 TRINITY_DN74208_c0_g1~~TRINITY_DN74208_c0_g1_i1.p1  ORF type:complete len:702 (-),score=88.45 TRINITY_DN74208_c0_g1_i1:131-2236(-)
MAPPGSSRQPTLAPRRPEGQRPSAPPALRRRGTFRPPADSPRAPVAQQSLAAVLPQVPNSAATPSQGSTITASMRRIAYRKARAALQELQGLPEQEGDQRGSGRLSLRMAFAAVHGATRDTVRINNALGALRKIAQNRDEDAQSEGIKVPEQEEVQKDAPAATKSVVDEASVVEDMTPDECRDMMGFACDGGLSSFVASLRDEASKRNERIEEIDELMKLSSKTQEALSALRAESARRLAELNDLGDSFGAQATKAADLVRQVCGDIELVRLRLSQLTSPSGSGMTVSLLGTNDGAQRDITSPSARASSAADTDDTSDYDYLHALVRQQSTSSSSFCETNMIIDSLKVLEHALLYKPIHLLKAAQQSSSGADGAVEGSGTSISMEPGSSSACADELGKVSMIPLATLSATPSASTCADSCCEIANDEARAYLEIVEDAVEDAQKTSPTRGVSGEDERWEGEEELDICRTDSTCLEEAKANREAMPSFSRGKSMSSDTSARPSLSLSNVEGWTRLPNPTIDSPRTPGGWPALHLEDWDEDEPMFPAPSLLSSLHERNLDNERRSDMAVAPQGSVEAICMERRWLALGGQMQAWKAPVLQRRFNLPRSSAKSPRVVDGEPSSRTSELFALTSEPMPLSPVVGGRSRRNSQDQRRSSCLMAGAAASVASRRARGLSLPSINASPQLSPNGVLQQVGARTLFGRR